MPTFIFVASFVLSIGGLFACFGWRGGWDDVSAAFLLITASIIGFPLGCFVCLIWASLVEVEDDGSE